MTFILSVRNALVLTASLAAVLVSQTAHAETLQLKFGLVASANSSTTADHYQPALNELETHVSEKLGRDVDIQVQIADDYDQHAASLKSGALDFSVLSDPNFTLDGKSLGSTFKVLAYEYHHNDANTGGLAGIGEPGNPWIARADLDSTIYEALQVSLLEVNTKDALNALNIEGFWSISDVRFALSQALDELSIDAVSAILAQQAMRVGEPELSAALPKNNGVLTAAQQINADRAASAMATRSIIATHPLEATPEFNQPAVESARVSNAITPEITLTPSDSADSANNLTINIALPQRLINPEGAAANSQNITINLSFPDSEVQATPSQR